MIKSIRIREGEIVSYQGANWRILHVEDMGRVLATRANDGHRDFLPIADLQLPLATEVEAAPGEEPPAADSESAPVGTESSDESAGSAYIKRLRARQLRSIEDVSKFDRVLPKSVDDALKRFDRIVKIIDAPRFERAPQIEALCKEFGLTTSSAYRQIRAVRMHRSVEAILHAVRTDKGSSRISPETQEVIRKNLGKYRFIPEPKTLSDVRDFINGEIRGRQSNEPQLKEISLSTLRKFEQETPLKRKLELQGRKKAAKSRFGSKVGQLPDMDFPLATIQIDHTPLQLCLVDEEDREPIGDAWLTLVIDCYSRMVLGFYLSFDAPSALSVGIALAHAFLPKEAYLRQIGVKGEWPCWGMPDVILVDNAAELNGQMMHSARLRLRFDLRDRPVGSPNFGGHVESAFRTFMNEIKSVPGTKFSNPIERGEYDSEGRAILTIAEFEHYFVEFLINDYHLDEHGGKNMERLTPLLKWKKGVLEGDLMPPTGVPDRPADPRMLRISLLPFEKRTIRGGRVEIFTEDYSNPALVLIGDQINLDAPRADRLYEVRYDPRDISTLWLLNPETNDYLDLAFTDLRKGSISLWEHNARKRRRGNPSAQFVDDRYESKKRREGIVEEAQKRTKQQRREGEKARHRAKSLATTPPPPAPPPPKPPGKAPLSDAQLKALREAVRPAAVPSNLGRPGDTKK